ncbi:MAG TPA: hypothetical protein VFZ48_03950 [Candidatus Saccharimonadales bacterium]
MAGRNERERLTALAKKMGVKFPPNASESELRRLIEAQPATERQQDEVAALLKRLRRNPPKALTFGIASRVIEATRDILNNEAMKRLNPQIDEIIFFQGEYYRIVEVTGGGASRSARLEEVTVQDQGKRKEVIPSGKITVCKLYELLDARKTNLKI